MIDPQIIDECRTGNMRNFRELVRETSPYIFSVAFRIIGDEEKAKDIVQESMITVWDKIKTLKSREAFQTWLYRIAVNKCYDSLRKTKEQPEFSSDEKIWRLLSDTISGGDDLQLEKDEISHIIQKLTEKLSPKQRIVFILVELEEKTHEEVTYITGMNPANIKANLHYAKKSIGEMLKKYI